MSAPPPAPKKDRTTAFIVLAVLLAFVAGTLFGIILAEMTTRPRTFDLGSYPPLPEDPLPPLPEDPEDLLPPPIPDSPPILPPPCAHPDPQPTHGRDSWCHRA